MPHICTRCNSIFESGEDILKGCPACGWKKFMFTRARPGEGKEPGEEQIITRAMGVRMPRGRGTKEKDQALKEEIKETYHTASSQAKVHSDRLLPASGPDAQKDNAPKDDSRKDDALRDDDEKLESIKIMSPGTYELNLPSLFEREELIMAVKEGTYFIDLSSAFRKGKKE